MDIGIGIEGHHVSWSSEQSKAAREASLTPEHYQSMPVEPWEVMQSTLTYEEFRGFLKGNIIKYAMRAGKKAGSDDEKKARHYMQKLAELTNEY